MQSESPSNRWQCFQGRRQCLQHWLSTASLRPTDQREARKASGRNASRSCRAKTYPLTCRHLTTRWSAAPGAKCSRSTIGGGTTWRYRVLRDSGGFVTSQRKRIRLLTELSLANRIERHLLKSQHVSGRPWRRRPDPCNPGQRVLKHSICGPYK